MRRDMVALVLMFSVVAALAARARAGEPQYFYAMNGDSFVRMLHREEPLAAFERAKAFSYIDGLRDATHGSVWCDVHQLKTPDLAYDLAYDIARMAPAERKRSAASLLLELLHRKFPCSVPRGSTP